eukprot:scaffold29139_cov90-Isochrysis_galbana.AAC.1
MARRLLFALLLVATAVGLRVAPKVGQKAIVHAGIAGRARAPVARVLMASNDGQRGGDLGQSAPAGP